MFRRAMIYDPQLPFINMPLLGYQCYRIRPGAMCMCNIGPPGGIHRSTGDPLVVSVPCLKYEQLLMS